MKLFAIDSAKSEEMLNGRLYIDLHTCLRTH